jgi:hypothetical protein
MRRIAQITVLLVAVLTLFLARAPAQAAAPPAEKNCVGKANKAKIQAYIVLLRLRYDIYAKWKETGVWPDELARKRRILNQSNARRSLGDSREH